MAMAFPTSVNDQITDAVSQSNVQVLGDASAQAAGVLAQSMAQAIGLAAMNATAQQQNTATLAQAVTARATAALLGGQASKPQ